MKHSRITKRLRCEVLEPRLMLSGNHVVISEFMALNNSTIDDGDGDASDWIELLNTGSTPADLTGYYLTDKSGDLTRWAFPTGTTIAPKSTLLVFASDKGLAGPVGELHTSFALSGGGEFLALVASNGTTIVHGFVPSFPAQQADVSFGLAMTSAQVTLVDEATSLRYVVPTNNSVDATWRSPALNDSSWGSGTAGVGYENSPGGANDYTSLLDVTLPSGTTTATADTKIVYTTNGTAPTVDANLNITNGILYTDPLQITHTSNLRAAAFKTSFAPTEVVTHTYIFVGDVVRQTQQAALNAGFPANWGSRSADYGLDPDVIGGNDPAADVNGDGAVNGLDVDPFVDILRNGGNDPAADMNGDGAVNGLDVDLFVQSVIGGDALKNSLLAIPTISLTINNADFFQSPSGIYANITLTDVTRIRARILRGGEWSALTDATFIPGFVSSDNVVNSEINDHPVNSSTAALAADDTLWRNQLGNSGSGGGSTAQALSRAPTGAVEAELVAPLENHSESDGDSFDLQSSQCDGGSWSLDAAERQPRDRLFAVHADQAIERSWWDAPRSHQPGPLRERASDSVMQELSAEGRRRRAAHSKPQCREFLDFQVVSSQAFGSSMATTSAGRPISSASRRWTSKSPAMLLNCPLPTASKAWDRPRD